ncbi:cation:proton antiporter [Luteolibacter luteus]|uniref:Cation/H(+) antiporter n=1 Tax=Luteolibacter luteus TaxID=2728835 RepID=A0A858RD53_9BACT|nr:cation:proton antiporter [Luteolibacter luteus]QJE94319.1 cation/H(+) antiporter [Luteolibacter luteus]
MNRNTIFYLVMLLIVGGGILGVVKLGAHLPGPVHTEATLAAEAAKPHVAAAVPASGSALGAMWSTLRTNLDHPLSHLFIQLLVIISASRLVGGLFTKFGQPAVVGEMMAGILLGPSLLGWVSPDIFQFVFPQTSLGTLKLLSQIGVCLFMFTVGMELDVRQVRNKAHTAVVVSHASIVAPYFLGVVLAYFLYSSLAQPGTNFTAFALFMGISMSITAFPVLARILQERGMAKSYLGNTAVTCAAVDDVTAWSALAFVVAIAGSTSVIGSALNLGLVVLFIAAMIWGLRPLLPRLFGKEELERPEPSKRTLAITICAVLIAALCTETVGIHALFGSFLAGAIMPEIAGFRHKLAVRVENFSTVLLLPLFFAFTGLRTQIGLLNDLGGWLICLGIIAVATAGKLGGSALTARFTGMSWRDSLQLGALMNTRGLMELIALNIGYDLGILSPRIFAMLVIMALVTTAMTGPLLSLFQRMPVRDEAPDGLARS